MIVSVISQSYGKSRWLLNNRTLTKYLVSSLRSELGAYPPGGVSFFSNVFILQSRKSFGRFSNSLRSYQCNCHSVSPSRALKLLKMSFLSA